MKKILVVDDSALMRRVLCDIINSDSRFHVEDRANNGLEALDLLGRKTYDAVVLDVNMPQMNGLELLKELQKRKISAKIIMASTDTADGAKVTLDALELGALDFIHKPTSALDCRNGTFSQGLLRILAAVTDVETLAPTQTPVSAAPVTPAMPFGVGAARNMAGRTGAVPAVEKRRRRRLQEGRFTIREPRLWRWQALRAVQKLCRR